MKTKILGVTVATRIPTEVKEELDEICEANNFFLAEFVRVAILESIASFKARESGKKEVCDEA